MRYTAISIAPKSPQRGTADVAVGHALTAAAPPALPREWVGLLNEGVPEMEADQSWIRLIRDEKLSLLRFIGALDVYGLTGKPLKRASISSAHAESRLIEAGAVITSDGRRAIFALLDRIRAMPSANYAVQTMNEAFPRLTKLVSARTLALCEACALVWGPQTALLRIAN